MPQASRQRCSSCTGGPGDSRGPRPETRRRLYPSTASLTCARSRVAQSEAKTDFPSLGFLEVRSRMTEQEGFRPTGRHARSGRCTLCGNRATLTKAHVPPRAAFNEGSVSWGGTTGDNRLVYGRPKSGGAKLYAHCQACRARTSPWDDEYLRWAYTFADNLFRSPGKGQRTHIEPEFHNCS